MTPLVVSLFCLSFAIAASSARGQVRDGAPQATGTGAIAGIVVSEGEQPRPVRRAIVTVSSSDPYVGRTTITDDTGRFAFVTLPAGRYTLNATKRGWTSGSYGAKAIGRPGRALQLGAGERATATIRIASGGVITGTVLDQYGQPMTGLTLRVMKYGYTPNGGERRLNPVFVPIASPDDRGVYRIYGLGAGDYYISAAPAGIGFQFQGRDLHLTSDVDVDEALKAVAAGPSGPIVDVPQPNLGYAQVFYPGVTSVAQATPVTVHAGEERAGVDFMIPHSPVARVDGMLLSPDGTPVAERVMLVPNDPSNPGTGFESIRNTQAGPDGRFTFSEVPPGPYIVSAHLTVPPVTPGDPPQVFNTASDLDVQSENVTGLSLTLQDSVVVSGVLQYDGAAPPPNLSTLRVMISPMQTATVMVATGGNTTAENGRFKIPGIAPGRYRLSVGQPAPVVPWTVRSIVVAGQDALDGFADIRQSTADAVITVTDRVASLSGKVDAGSGGSSDFTMVLFSADRAQWRAQSRRILNARTSSDGGYTFRVVPPGEYFLAPVDDMEPGESFDPAFLQRLAPGAMRITIGEGEKKVQDVRVGGG